MPRFNPHRFRLERANDLTYLYDILKKMDICVTLDPLSDAIKNLQETSEKNQYWEYNISELTLKLNDIPRNSFPNIFKNCSIKINLSLKGDIKNVYKDEDPFNEFNFGIIVQGTTYENEQYFYCFHFDREEKTDFDCVHPRYHLQYGGAKLKKLGGNFGCYLFMNPPRFVHYPMDLVLGIDFLLSNFFYRKRQELLENGIYTNIIKKSQDITLKPYMNLLASEWNNPIRNNAIWNIQSILPQFIRIRQ